MGASSRLPIRDWFVGSEVLGAVLLVVGLVAVSTVVPVQVVQIPGYLLVLGSDQIQNPLLPGLTGWSYTAFFAAYLYGVAVLLGNLYRWGQGLRTQQ